MWGLGLVICAALVGFGVAILIDARRLFAFACIAMLATSAHAREVTFSPSRATVQVGRAVDLGIEINDASAPLLSVEATLSAAFPIRVQEISPSAANDDECMFAQHADRGRAQFSLACPRALRRGGSARIATLRVVGVAPGKARVHWERCSLNETTLPCAPADATITVTP